MTRFTELLKTGELHSAYENTDTTPSSVENPVNPEPLNFQSMTKLQLEEYGRTIGIELDRRYTKSKLIQQLKNHING